MTVVDRIEDGVAYLESGGVLSPLSLSLLPADAKEGDVLRQKNGVYRVAPFRTMLRKRKMARKLRRLLKK